MKYGLYRETPFRPLYTKGIGFTRPLRDEERPLWIFSSESAAIALRKYLRSDDGLIFVEKLSRIKERIKNEYETTS